MPILALITPGPTELLIMLFMIGLMIGVPLLIVVLVIILAKKSKSKPPKNPDS